MNKRQLSPAKVFAILRAHFEQQMSTTAIAEKLDVEETTIWRICLPKDAPRYKVRYIKVRNQYFAGMRPLVEEEL